MVRKVALKIVGWKDNKGFLQSLPLGAGKCAKNSNKLEFEKRKIILLPVGVQYLQMFCKLTFLFLLKRGSIKMQILKILFS